MKFLAKVSIMPLEELLDPQGKVVNRSLTNLGLAEMENVRIGKHIRFTISANDEAIARSMVELACTKLLANLIMESYEFEIEPIADEV
jgi:phosphoribosylformylglycinamidine synthase